MKNLFFVLFSFWVLNSLLFAQYQPNYPHTSEGTVEMYYYVVIGSMQSSSNADRLADKAREKGFDVEILYFNKNNTLMHRVCVGKSKSKSDINQTVKDVKRKLRISNCWVLENPVVVPISEEKKYEQKVQKIKQEHATFQEERTKITEKNKHEQEVLKKEKEEAQKKIDKIKELNDEQLLEINRAVQEKIESDKQGQQELIQAEENNTKSTINEEQLLEIEKKAKLLEEQIKEQARLTEQKGLEAKKQAEFARLQAEQQKAEAEKQADFARLQAEQQKAEAEKQAEQQRIMAQQKEEEQEIAPEQEKVVPEETFIEEKDVQSEKVQILVQKSPDISPVVTANTVQMQTIDEPFNIEKDSPIKTVEYTSQTILTEEQKKEFLNQFRKFIEHLRNYEYMMANQYIHPESNLYTFYKDESSPSVKVFTSFEKFFAVFSTFTGKGSSYDFSLDIEMLLKDDMKFAEFPEYNCEKGEYSILGQYASNIDGNQTNFSQMATKYFNSLNADFIELKPSIDNLNRRICVSVVNTNNTFIEGLYFSLIEDKWYLTAMDLRIKCK